MASSSSIMAWLPRMLLLLSPILLIVVLLLCMGDQAALLVGAGVFCILAEIFSPQHTAESRPVVCVIPLVSGGFVRASGRTAFVAFAVGYTGYTLANIVDAALFLFALVMLMLDTALAYYLGCFSASRMMCTAAIGVTAGALYRYALQLGAKRGLRQTGCKSCT